MAGRDTLRISARGAYVFAAASSDPGRGLPSTNLPLPAIGTIANDPLCALCSALQRRLRTVYNGRQPMHPPAGIEFVTRRSRLNLRLRLIAAFAAGVLAVGCGAFVADPG